MKKLIYVQMMAVAVLALFLLNSCGGVSKMANHPEDVSYTVTPAVLEDVGNKVNFTVDATVAPKYFKKKAVVVLFPEIKCTNGKSIMLDPQIIVGEKESDLGYPTIALKPGGKVTYKGSTAFIPEMEQSELQVNMFVLKAKDFKKITNRNSYSEYTAIKSPDHVQKLADGVIVTSTRIQNGQKVAYMAHGYEKVTKVSKSADYYFHISSANYSASYGLNKSVNAKKMIVDVQDFLNLGWKVDNVTINGWASPDGENKYNNQLSDHRALAIQKVWEKTFKAKGIAAVARGNGQDWDGYTANVNASSVPDKAAALAVMNFNSMEERQVAIAKLVDKYPDLNTAVLEPLRRAVLTVTLFEPKFTDEELAQYGLSNPDKLKEPEILYAATLHSGDLDKQYTVYKNAIQQYPKSAAAYNNAAATAILLAKDADAENYIKQAVTLNANAPEIANNEGVLAINNGKLDQAATFFNSAKNLPEAKYNTGLLEIASGNFTQAQGLLSGDKCTYGLGLIQLETGKIDDAINTLNCCEHKVPEVDYLTAVAYARKGDKTNMITKLKAAVVADPKLKAIAKTDREFIKFFQDPSFVDIVR